MAYNKEYYQKNREKILKRQRGNYWKSPERYRNYCKAYKLNNKDKTIARNLRYNRTPAGIYYKLKQRNSEKIISKENFSQWYVAQKKLCVYCGEIEGKVRLQIDRKDNKLGYPEGNLALACKRCNFIKRDWFSYEDMLEIGKTISKIKTANYLADKT